MVGDEMESVTFINARGEEIEFYSSPYQLEVLNGLGDVSADVQRQKAAFQNGSTFIGAYLNERFIDISFKIRGEDYDDIMNKRRELARIVNPVLGLGTIIIKSNGQIRTIGAVAEALPSYPSGQSNRGWAWQNSSISFICPDPYFTGGPSDDVSYKLEDFVGNFRFPFHFKVRFATRGDSKIIYNDSDADCPVIVEFRGLAKNPVIKNDTTGQFIKVERVIPEGYTLIINTAFGNKSVNIVAPDGVSESAMNYISNDSQFFMLQQGENKISFISEEGEPEVFINYKKRYSAI